MNAIGTLERAPVSALPDSILRDLRAIVGDRLSIGLPEREQHGRGESYHSTVPPDAVCYAVSTDEVANIVTVCTAHSVAVIPFGAGTSLEGHVGALNGGVCFDLSRMNQILAVHAEDLDVTLQAGVTRHQLNDHLRDTGLFFPVDPGGESTLGGMAPTPIPINELYTAVQTGVVDGFEHDPSTVLAYKLYEVSKNCFLTRHIYTPMLAYIGKRGLAKIPADLLPEFKQAAAVATASSRKEVASVEAEAVADLKFKGIVFIDVPSAELVALKLRMAEDLYPAFLKQYPDTVPLFNEIKASA